MQRVYRQFLSKVRRALVFRALMLGDLLCATPALRGLREAMPQAHIVLCGLQKTAELGRRLPMIDEFQMFPGHPELPEQSSDTHELNNFLHTMRRRRFDLALQMHGSGSIVNDVVSQFGARITAGFAVRGTEAALDLAVPWPEQGSEIERCLVLTDAIGAPRLGLHLDFPILESDRYQAARLLEAVGVAGSYALIHPGSQLPSRRWAPERFAVVADALAAKGLAVMITGTPGEAPLAAAMRAASARTLIDLTGRSRSLGILAALVESATLVVTNDTGMSHVAAALRTPSVVIASGSDVARWAPLDRRLHSVHWHETACRPCAHVVCPTEHECAAGVAPAAVIATALALVSG